MSRASLWNNVATGILVACALLMTGTAVRRQFFPSRTAPASSDVPIKEWDALLSSAFPVLGSVSSNLDTGKTSLTVVEFADYQCPYCAHVHDSLKAFVKRSPRSVRYYFANFPLTSIHPYAYRAALASACAANQGQLLPIMDELYGHQAAIGHSSWDEIASRAKIADATAFAECMREEQPRARIEESIRIAKLVGVGGTPSFAVNGVLLGAVRTVRDLEARVSQLP